MRGRTRVKKWGGSLAIVISSELARAKKLRPGAEVEYDVEPIGLRVCDIAGMFHGLFTKADLRAMEAELARGWDK